MLGTSYSHYIHKPIEVANKNIANLVAQSYRLLYKHLISHRLFNHINYIDGEHHSRATRLPTNV